MQLRRVLSLLLVFAALGSTAPAAADHLPPDLTIDMSNFRFCETVQCAWPAESPHSTVRLASDDAFTIHFVYLDNACDALGEDCDGHQVRSVSANWDIPLQSVSKDDREVTVTLSTPGTYTFRCEIHGQPFLSGDPPGSLTRGMTGEIEVVEL